MIYELSIELFNGKKPVTRILRVDEDTSLQQLHYIIQVAFDWSGLRPHIYLSHLGDQVKAIGDLNELRQPALEFFRDWSVLDEKKQKLSSWMKKIDDSIIYEYYQNFKKRRFHLIELKNILPGEEGVIYPNCVSAEYLSPKEAYASRASKLSHSLTTENVNSLTSLINQLLLQEDIIISEPACGREAYYEDHLSIVAYDYLYQKPWLNIAEDQIISVVDHESEIQLFCSVGGSDGQDPGLSIFVGEDAFLELQNSAEFYHQTKNALSTLNRLEKFYGIGIIFREANELTGASNLNDSFKELWKQAPLEEGRQLLPFYFSYKSDTVSPERLTAIEMRWLILCLEQMLAVNDLIKKGLMIPSLNESNKLLERSYSMIYKQYINQEIRLLNK